MKSKIFTFLITLIFSGINHFASAQSFLNDYEYYLRHKTGKVSAERKLLIDKAIAQIHTTIDLFEKVNKQTFFSADTIYYLHIRGAETTTTEHILWNKNSSCYFRKDVNKDPVIKPDARDIIQSFTKKFRKAVELVDTAAYHSYAVQNKVLDGSYVSAKVAVRIKKHWHFFTFKESGWAINYDLELPAAKN